ncbi:MAG: polysaccharide pyruvyl transferase family protein, partial [Bacteroidales bacterium]|nr:polysaccharide pyruvyl transferase family protein [Bacteroidales bacterium]
MKVGILTYHYICNFGAQLQAYATVSGLKKLGFEPVVIDFVHTDLMTEYYGKEVSASQQEAHAQFVRDFLPITERCTTEAEITDVVDKHDIRNIIVGSDAVFLLTYPARRYSDTRYPSIYWMGWLNKCKNYPDIRVFGLSVSAMGTNFLRLPKSYIPGLRKSLDNFKAIYYRDQWTRWFLSYRLGRHGLKRSPDPVLAFNALVDKAVMDKVSVPVSGKYVLYGISGRMGEKHHELLLEIKKRVNARGFQFIALPFPEGYYSALDDTRITEALSPLQWYALIKGASGYIGEKFHPVIISIHNEVPFFAIDRNGDRVSRRFLIPVHLKFQSKTWDTCKYYGFRDAYIPLSKFRETDPDKIVSLLFDKQWDFSRSRP